MVQLQQERQKRIEQTFELAREGKWAECEKKAGEIDKPTPEVQATAAWAKAQQAYGRDDLDAAVSALAGVQDSYNGTFSKEILLMKNSILPQRLEERRIARQRAAFRAKMEERGCEWIYEEDGVDYYGGRVARDNPFGTAYFATVYSSNGDELSFHKYANPYYRLNGGGQRLVRESGLATAIHNYAQPIASEQSRQYLNSPKGRRIRY